MLGQTCTLLYLPLFSRECTVYCRSCRSHLLMVV